MSDKRQIHIPDLTAGDLAPGTGFEVVVQEDGTFEVTVFYNWKRRGEYYDGQGVGPTWREAAGRAISDAEGEDFEEFLTEQAEAEQVAAEAMAKGHRTGDLR